MYDYHIHSSFSEDCNIEMEVMIKKAIELKAKEICFTEHLDYDYTDSDFEFLLDVDSYNKKIYHLQNLYKDKIKILRGIELGVQPHILEKCESVIKENNFDFVIASIHTCEKKDLYSGEFFKGKTVDESWYKYFEELLYIVKNFENFNVIGHLDIIRRYDKEVANANIEKYFDVLEVILSNLIEKGKGIEINAGGFRYNLGETNPSVSIIKLYKKLGGEIITFGSDAHGPDRIIDYYAYVEAMLKEIGFKYITTFENMKPKFIKLK